MISFLKVVTRKSLVCIAFPLFCFIGNSIAQSSEYVLSDTELMNAMTSNKYSGVNVYHGIYQKITVTVASDNPVSANDSTQIVNSINALSGVISCNFSPSTSTLVVRTKREFESTANIVTIKQVIVTKSVFIKNYSEINYQSH